jgi:pyruvate/2-oxoglutarate dehydrogenase complex dihydrolipoamide acyltransferase (E2) component
MSTEIRIPKLGISMEEAVLTEWFVADGSQVEVGAVLYSLETDKSVQEVESPVSGTVRIVGVTGETYPVGALIGSIEE